MKIHIVQKGDTLWKIAQKYDVDFEKLKQMNTHLSNPDMIMPGMKIKVPTQGVPVKKKEAVHPYKDESPKETPVKAEVEKEKKEKPKKKEAPQMPTMPQQQVSPDITQKMYNYDFNFNVPKFPVMPVGEVEEEEESPDVELPKPKQPTQVAGVQEEVPPMMPKMPAMPVAPAMPQMPVQHQPCPPVTGFMPSPSYPPCPPYHAGYQPFPPYHGGYHETPYAPMATGYPHVATPGVEQSYYGYPQESVLGVEPQKMSPEELGGYDDFPGATMPNMYGAGQMPYGASPVAPQMQGTPYPAGAQGYAAPNYIQTPEVGGIYPQAYPTGAGMNPGYPQMPVGMNPGYGQYVPSNAGSDCGCGGPKQSVPNYMTAPNMGYYQPMQSNLPYGPYETPPYPPYGLPREEENRDMDEYEEESN